MSKLLKASSQPRSRAMSGVVLLAAIGLSGCGGGGEDNTVGFVTTPSGETDPIVIHSPAQIAQVSADNYDDNVNGLISGATLKRWKDDWINERPAGITGKLVILQVSEGPAGAEYIMPNGSNVFTYLSPSSEWIQTRSNGVISTPSMVPDGASMDALLVKYNINPHTDMIVTAMGTGTTGNAMGQGRIWYALRYWGVEAQHLALVNGGNQWLNGSSMTAADFQATGSSAPGTGFVSVKSLASDNTALQATFEDLMSVLPSSDSNVLDDGVFIWDARGMNQYSAGEMLEMGQSGCAAAYCAPPPGFNYMSTFQNSGSRQGHPRGGMQLQFTNMLVAAEGYRYKDKAELIAYLNGDVDANGLGIVDSSYQLVGAGNAYQAGDTVYTYCETTFRAMITGVVSAVILGNPTRFYDGAMIEWNSLSYLQDATGSYILPMNSPWRTDVLSYYRPASDPALVATRAIDNPYATHANAIIQADKAYKASSSSSGDSGSGGGALPPNPCGG